MDLRNAIALEHSRAQAVKIARYIGDDRVRFKDLIDIYLDGPYRITQRAAWVISICVERYPQLIVPHLTKLINHLSNSGIPDAAKRNTVRILQFVEIPKRNVGKVATICFKFLQDTREPVAVKVFSMSVLAKIAVVEPALKSELRIIIEDQLPYASAGFRSRARKVLKEIR